MMEEKIKLLKAQHAKAKSDSECKMIQIELQKLSESNPVAFENAMLNLLQETIEQVRKNKAN